MSLRDITQQAVLDAISEFNTLTREVFLTTYEFGKAKKYWLIYDGQRYDSKAIVGVAHKYATNLGPLKNSEFSGGKKTVKPKLCSLGFTVIDSKNEVNQLILPSESSPPPFDPSDETDARGRISRMIASRQGQGAFRHKILNAYNRRCAISDCAVVDVLEAAHIVPYRGPKTNVASNGLLLRADIHTLFDLGMVAIDSSLRVHVHNNLSETEYWAFNNKELRVPSATKQKPNMEALKLHLDRSLL